MADALIPSAYVTLQDISRNGNDAMMPSGRDRKAAAELLTRTSKFIAKLKWQVGNNQSGHTYTYHDSLITPEFTRYGVGVRGDKGTMSEVSVRCGRLQSYWEQDRDLMDIGSREENVMKQNRFFHIGNAHRAVDALIYGSEAQNPDEITGLARYYDDRKTETGKVFIIDAGGSAANNRSCYYVGTGPGAAYGIVPAGRPMGLRVHNPATHPDGSFMSQTARTMTDPDATDARQLVIGRHFTWWLGFVLEDPRQCVRIANIDPTDVRDDASDGPNLWKLMQRAQRLVKPMPGVEYFWIMPRGLAISLMAQENAAVTSSTLAKSDLGGEGLEDLMFGGKPVCIEDALDEVAEARVI